MIPIDCEIACTSLFAFFNNYNYIGWTSAYCFKRKNNRIIPSQYQELIGKLFSQYDSYSPIFSPLHSIATENSMESTCTVNTEYLFIKTHAPTIAQKVGASLLFLSSNFEHIV